MLTAQLLIRLNRAEMKELEHWARAEDRKVADLARKLLRFGMAKYRKVGNLYKLV